MMDSIAFQTHILVLNAAVEAAKEIKTLMSRSVANVERGSHLVGGAG